MLFPFELPWHVLAVVAGLLGMIIGSFLNVVIYRLHTGRSVQGRSHCLSCGTHLVWYDLLPAVSYVALRGRCRTCGARISPRYWLVEVATGLLFIGVSLVESSWVLMVLMWAVMAVLVVVVVYDYYHLIIPNITVLWLLGLALIMYGYTGYLSQDWYGLFIDALVSVSAATFFAGLWWVSGGRWIGLGDAKLALPLGLMVGAGSVFSLVVMSFWCGAILSLLIIGWQHLWQRGQPHLRFLARPLTIKSEVPFAPFLVLSFLAIYFFSIDVLALTSLLV